MSGFENYDDELARIDREIVFYARACGVDVLDEQALARLAAVHPAGAPSDARWETLRALLVLRTRVETEMIELGMRAPPPAAWGGAP